MLKNLFKKKKRNTKRIKKRRRSTKSGIKRGKSAKAWTGDI